MVPSFPSLSKLPLKPGKTGRAVNDSQSFHSRQPVIRKTRGKHLAREPNLQIVGFGRSKTQISSRQGNYSIVKARTLQNLSGLPSSPTVFS